MVANAAKHAYDTQPDDVARASPSYSIEAEEAGRRRNRRYHSLCGVSIKKLKSIAGQRRQKLLA